VGLFTGIAMPRSGCSRTTLKQFAKQPNIWRDTVPDTLGIKKIKVLSPTAKLGPIGPAGPLGSAVPRPSVDPLTGRLDPATAAPADVTIKAPTAKALNSAKPEKSKTAKVRVKTVKSKAPNTKQTPAAKAGAAPKTFLPKPVAGSAGFDQGAQTMPAAPAAAPAMPALNGPGPELLG
jgi:hypothetical protein